MEELKRKNQKSKVGEDEDSLLFNAELAAGAVSSILKDSDLGRSKALPVERDSGSIPSRGRLGKSLHPVVSISMLIPCWMLISCLMCR